MAISDANYNYCSSESHALDVKSKSIFKTPLLFGGLGPQGLIDSDLLRSPTSPLDVLSIRGNNPLRKSSPPDEGGSQRSWNCSKVGLSIIDSMEKNCSKFSENILLSSCCKRVCLSPKLITKAPNYKSCIDSVHASKSLPKGFFNYTKSGSNFHQGEPKSKSNVFFEIGEPFGKTMSYSNIDSKNSGNFALNPVSSPPHFIGGSTNPEKHESAASFTNDLVKCLSASEIENSEDYTCVISRGPNPKTTHIFCDCILEIHADGVKKDHTNEEKEGLSSPVVDRIETPNQYFLSFCNHCNNKLEEGEDIYIYRDSMLSCIRVRVIGSRLDGSNGKSTPSDLDTTMALRWGEKAFCSLTCREMEIMMDPELEESNAPCENSLESRSGAEIFETGIFTAK